MLKAPNSTKMSLASNDSKIILLDMFEKS